jgi:hypothetical protein
MDRIFLRRNNHDYILIHTDHSCCSCMNDDIDWELYWSMGIELLFLITIGLDSIRGIVLVVVVDMLAVVSFLNKQETINQSIVDTVSIW